MAKRSNSVIQTEIGEHTLTFKVEGAADMVLDTRLLHKDILTRAVMHGLKQRVSDAAAIPCDEETGKPATPVEKAAAMKAIVDHYNSGAAEWSIGRTASGEREEGGITLRAVADVQGVDIETMRARVTELAEKKGLTTKAIYGQLAKSPDVIRKIAELRAAKAGVNSDDILAELG